MGRLNRAGVAILSFIGNHNRPTCVQIVVSFLTRMFTNLQGSL